MAKRGIFRRIVDAVFGRTQPEKKPSFTPSYTPSDVSPSFDISDRERNAVVEHMVATLPFANRNRVAINVGLMTPEELRWARNASHSQLQAAARQDASRVLVKSDGSEIPINPFWYG